MPPRLLAVLALLASSRGAAAQQPDSAGPLVRRWVRPSEADSAIRRFDEANYVVFDSGVGPAAPLLVFLPGTGGRPRGTTDFADLAARRGYRVIGLEYDDVPAVAAVCPRQPDPGCAERFRVKRIYGEDVTALIDDRPEESIATRLARLLATLARGHPEERWDGYLAGGQPDWEKIAVAGLSQGAGMAALLAQRTRVARVILFSSPWDNYGPRHTLAPWVTRGNGATPPERWFAPYHAKEPTAEIIARAYRALHVPGEHVRVFTLDPAPGASRDAYHPSVVGIGPTPRRPDGTPAYLDEWVFLLGDARPAAAGGT